MTAAARQGLSVAEAIALPVMFNVWPTVGRALNIGRTATFQLAAEDSLPIPVIRVGRQLRAKRSDLLAFLGLENSDAVGSPVPTASNEHNTETASQQIEGAQ